MLAWMITAQESSTVAWYRRAAVRSPAPTSSWFTNEIAHLDALRRGRRGIQHGPTRAAFDTGTEPRRPRLRRRFGPGHDARAAACASSCQNRPPGCHPDLSCSHPHAYFWLRTQPSAGGCLDEGNGPDGDLLRDLIDPRWPRARAITLLLVIVGKRICCEAKGRRPAPFSKSAPIAQGIEQSFLNRSKTPSGESKVPLTCGNAARRLASCGSVGHR